MTALVSVTEVDDHLLVTMDDGKANALSFAMLDELNGALDVAAEAGKVLVIAGREGRFSAGFDLSVMGAGGEPMLRLLRQGADLSIRLLSFNTPVVLAVTGHALAMGALLCLSADYRVGTRGNFKLGLNEVAIGMTLPWFGIELARARIEETQLSQAVGLAHVYGPDDAVSAGYLDEAVSEDAVLPRARELAAVFAGLDMRAHRETKARLREDLFARLERALARDFDSGSGAVGR